jgi:hypothetical protein
MSHKTIRSRSENPRVPKTAGGCGSIAAEEELTPIL